jgi:anti-sigma factor (TIGR02949 family)
VHKGGTDSGAAHPSGGPATAGAPECPSPTEDRVKCSDVISQISDYLDPEAAQELCADLETHFAECPNCRVYIDTVKKTISLYRSETPLECPEQVRTRLHTILSYEYRKK